MAKQRRRENKMESKRIMKEKLDKKEIEQITKILENIKFFRIKNIVSHDENAGGFRITFQLIEVNEETYLLKNLIKGIPENEKSRLKKLEKEISEFLARHNK